MKRHAAVVFMAMVLAAGASSGALGQQPPAGQIQPVGRAALTHPQWMAVLDETLGQKAPEQLRLNAGQSEKIRAAHDDFERQVKEFVRRHAGDMDGNAEPSQTRAEGKIPSREETERRVLELLRADQRGAVEEALTKAAGAGGRTGSARGGTDSKSDSSSDSSADHHSSSQSSHNSSSQTSRDSRSNSDAHSSKDAHSIKDGPSSKDSKSDHQQKVRSSGSKDQQKKGESGAKTQTSNQSARKSWSSLDTVQRREALRNLMDQIGAEDRAVLEKELKKAAPAPHR